MKRFLLVLTASLMLVVFVSAVTANAADTVESPSPTVIPDGPTVPIKPTTGTTGSGGTTSPDGTGITTAKPGETQTLKPGDGDDATGGSTTKGGESSTAKPDDSDTSPETGGGERLLGAAFILVSGMAVAACVDQKSKKAAQAE